MIHLTQKFFKVADALG